MKWLLTCCTLFLCFTLLAQHPIPGPQINPPTFYRMVVFHFKSTDQEKAIDKYLEISLLPAWHRTQAGSIGVFKPIANDTSVDRRIYVLFPQKLANHFLQWETDLEKDSVYQISAANFLSAPFDQPPFERMESILLTPFKFAPKLQLPKLITAKSEHIYELRSYESATPSLFNSKVHMFNEGKEMALFQQLNFNAVFYGSVWSGAHMPNLMYLTSFNNMADHDAHWKAFGEAPEWKRMSSLPEYEHTISHMDIILMHAAPYSDY